MSWVRCPFSDWFWWDGNGPEPDLTKKELEELQQWVWDELRNDYATRGADKDTQTTPA